MAKSIWVVLVFIFTFQLSLGQKESSISFGASVGGAGLAGLVIGYTPIQQLDMDLGIYARLSRVGVFETRWQPGLASDLGLSLYPFIKLKADKKSISNGFFAKAGFGKSKNLDELILCTGWSRKSTIFSSKAKSQQIQIGPSLVRHMETYLNTRYPPGAQEQSETFWTGMVYFRWVYFFKG